ncbi:adenylate/guanylate cyclase domain-containing protein [Egicoccus sp. AB-alg6-2]|uniref:adenylate/guanylate cyclase domain-containing protein n=1 Tax=Egicoccus sp. AB-alg6-2 TaxID=3242692 RepID=UPI00359CCAEA
MDTCGTCGEQNPAHARFCLGCGQPRHAGDDEARKVVTVLFADVVGSTDLGERHDPEAYRAVLNRYFERIQTIVSRHGGVVEKFIGDAVMAVFGLPTVHEDDALRAVRAAVEIRDEVEGMAAAAVPGRVTLQWRLGVNTGEVLVGGAGGRTLATGDAVNVAARLEQVAAPGEVLIGETTCGLVRHAVVVDVLEPLRVRGKAAPLRAYRVREVDAGAVAQARRFDLPFVGREAELELVAWTVRRTLQAGAPHLLTVYGAAGIGKTRLATTALEQAPVRTLYGRCLPYGDGVTYWPLAEALASAAGITDADTQEEIHDKLATLAGGAVPSETLSTAAAAVGLTDAVLSVDPDDALADLLAACAGDAGLAIVIDDLHNAEPPLLDLLDRLARSRSGPLLLLGIARPELLEHRPGWAGGTTGALSLTLAPLEDRDVARLVDDRLDGPVDPLAVERLTAAAAGNPLFLEELVATLVEAGSLRRTTDGSWSLAEPEGQLALPASIHLLLASRIDRLDAEDRAFLGRAAVCGEAFSCDAVAALTAEAEHDDVVARAERLVDRELLRPGPEGYEFRHKFVRDAVYAGLPRRLRADLHERHAAALEARSPSPRVDEFVLLHLERALDERVRLEPTDVRIGLLATRHGQRAADAGCRALARGDMPAAVRLLGHAVDRLPPDDPRLAQLLTDRGRAFAEVGNFAAAEDELRRAIRTAELAGDRHVRMHALLSAAWVRSNVDLDGWAAYATEVSDEAIAVFTAAADDRGLGRAWGLRAEVHFLRGRFADALQAMERAESHARAAGDEAEERENAVAAAFVLPLGPWPVEEALARCTSLLERYAGEPALEARVLQIVALLRAMSGEGDAARDALVGAQVRFAELGQRYWAAAATVLQGHVERLVGVPEAALDALRSGMALLEEMGDHAQAAVVAATVAVCLPDPDDPEVVRLTEQARRNAAADDVEAQVRLRMAEARLARGARDHSAAVTSARDAVAIASTTDSPVLQGDASLLLSEILVDEGSPAAAARALDVAEDRYAEKGHAVGLRDVARLRALSSTGAPRAGDPR